MGNVEDDDWVDHVHDDPVSQHAHDVYHGFATNFPTPFPSTSIEMSNIYSTSSSTISIYSYNAILLCFVLIRALMNII
ncbi:MAG: hypothetical protein CML47_00835 [Rhodobacteraceae bacterium]|nr:MAG: hypothetical protein CML47_00835 [Paracoccaceae bacterium]|tara:strand:- start:454 stop:687 length:234 start_codon:yes stop_codon:yes gene_type:complete